MRDIAHRNRTLDRNDGRNVKRSAYVTGSGRDFCDGELNYKKTTPSESFFNLYRLIRCERDESGYSGKQNFSVRSFGPAMAKSTKLLEFYFTQNFYHYNVYIILIFLFLLSEHCNINDCRPFFIK